MTIRFQCGACDQPIEIDEEWASKQAACPYCQKTIIVPSQSTLTELSSIPTAQPLSLDPASGWPVTPATAATARRESPNRLAIVAAVLAVLAVGFLILYGSVAAAHADDLADMKQLTEDLSEQGQNPISAAQQALARLYEENGGVPPDWMMALGALWAGGFLTFLAALVCSIIACFRPRRRGLAVAALVVTCMLPFISCGVMSSVM